MAKQTHLEAIAELRDAVEDMRTAVYEAESALDDLQAAGPPNVEHDRAVAWSEALVARIEADWIGWDLLMDGAPTRGDENVVRFELLLMLQDWFVKDFNKVKIE